METRELKAPADIEQIELDLLLEGIFQRYGYDFRSYSRASLERRVRQFRSSKGFDSLSDIISPVLREESFFAELAQYLSISVTEMFRDPLVYRALREHVVPLLRTYPHIKVWHAGCATGEEVYSLAILLVEEGLYDRATIYGTDFNDAVLEQAREGIFPANRVQEFTRCYQEAGGTASFSEYYHAKYDAAVMNAPLKQRLTFSNHNLTTDGVFGDMHLVLCRNVMIYFNNDLQDRVLGLFTESLVHGGFLCLGTKEDLQFSAVASSFQPVDREARIFKKVSP